MPVIMAILGLLAAFGYWFFVMRNAANGVKELAGMASDVASAARRFGFRRRHNQHPVDSLDDADVAIAGAGLAFMDLSGLPTSEQHDALAISLQHHLGHDVEKANEAMIVGRWLVTECGTAHSAFSRLTKRLFKLKNSEGFQPLMNVLTDVAKANRGGEISPQQSEALQDVARIFHLR